MPYGAWSSSDSGDLAEPNRANQAAAAADRTRERPHYPSKRTGWPMASAAGLCQERSFAVMAVAGSDLMLVKLRVDWTSAQCRIMSESIKRWRQQPASLHLPLRLPQSE